MQKFTSNSRGFSSVIALLITIGIVVVGFGIYLLTRPTLQPLDVPPAQESEQNDLINDVQSTDRTHVTTKEALQFKEPSDESGASYCSKNTCTIAMVIKKENYNALISEVSIWVTDVERDIGQKVELLIYENNVTKERIKFDLKNLYFSKNLRGAVLVGNIPYVKAGAPGTTAEGAFLDLSDYFYVDIKKECDYNSNADAIYNNCFADSTTQPFWVSRLTPPLHEEVEANKLLKDYFTRNHNFRTDRITFQQRYLAHAPILMEMQNPWRKSTIEGFLNKFRSEVSPYKLADVKFISPESNDNDFFNELRQPYEYVFYNGHGTPFSVQQDINYQTVITKSPKALFYEFVSCSVGRYSEEKYLAGAFLFNSDALAVLAAQVPIFGITQPNDDFQMFLRAGKTIGEASQYINIGAAKILGDGTLKLRYKKDALAEKAEIALEKLELDFGKLSLREVERRVAFKVKNVGNSPLIVNIKTTYPTPSKIYPVNGASVASFDLNQDVNIRSGEIKELFLNVALGDYSLPQTRPYIGQYSGFFYIYTNDPSNFIVKVPFRGEITE